MYAMMELEIGRGTEPNVFSVRVLRSVSGDEPARSFRLDLDELVARRPLVEATVLSSAVAARRVVPATEGVLRDVGERLFVATFDGAIGEAYRTSRALAAERGKSLQIAIRLTAPELATLPWESLFDPDASVYLCRKEPLVRRVAASHTPPALTIAQPLRILAMVASPRGLPAIDVEAERERLEDALRPELVDGHVHLEWLQEASWHAIHAKLLAAEWHVLHFIGHGMFDTQADEGLLAFVGQDGRADFVPANALADLLDEAEPTPRLVVLNSCQSGTNSDSDLFSGTAAALAHGGVRAVAAMQFAISDAAAVAFARGFYTALSYGRGVDEAVRSGRIGILGLGRGTLEWVTPMLFLRGDDAHIFSIARAAGRPADLVEPSREPDAVRNPEMVPAADAGEEPEAGRAPVAVPEPAPVPEHRVRREPRPELKSKASPFIGGNSGTRSQSSAGSRIGSRATKEVGFKVAKVRRWFGEFAVGRDGVLSSASRSNADPGRPAKLAGVVALIAIMATSIAVMLLQNSKSSPETTSSSLSWEELLDGRSSPAATPDPSTSPEWTTQELTVPLNLSPYAHLRTGLQCEAGDRLDITASGEGWYDASEASRVGPEGLPNGELPELRWFGILADFNTASLYARVGNSETGNEGVPLTFVGSGVSVTCQNDGELFFGVNDRNDEDNRGEFRVVVTRTSSRE